MTNQQPNIPLILHAVLEEYALPWDGDHGVAHWARVLENGLRLAGETGANVEVVRLFAILHDSRRVNEAIGPRPRPPCRRVRLGRSGAGCSTCPSRSSACCTGPVPGTRTSGHTPT